MLCCAIVYVNKNPIYLHCSFVWTPWYFLVHNVDNYLIFEKNTGNLQILSSF